jgi:hypothetical protein
MTSLWKEIKITQNKMGILPKNAPPRHLNIHVPQPQNVLLFYAPSFLLL